MRAIFRLGDYCLPFVATGGGGGWRQILCPSPNPQSKLGQQIRIKYREGRFFSLYHFSLLFPLLPTRKILRIPKLEKRKKWRFSLFSMIVIGSVELHALLLGKTR